MEMSFGSRLKHAWNAFNGNAVLDYRDIGTSYSYRVDRPRLSRGNERSIVTSVYNRIALDVAALKIEHVKLDESKRFLSVIEDGLNNCLSLEANTDQTARAFFQDVVISMFDEGSVAIVPVDTTTDPTVSGSYDIKSMRVGQILEWFPQHIRVRVYNELTGKKEDILLPKSTTGIIENPLYAVINEPNSTMQRLIRKLNLLDVIDEQSGSGTLSQDCEAEIPVHVDGITVNKKFSFAVAKAGNNGTSVTITSTNVTYATSSSGTTPPSSGWGSSVPTVSNGQYLWTKTAVKYSDGKSTESYSVSYKGTNGTNGSSVTVTSNQITYQAGTSATTKPTGTWSTTIPTVAKGQYLWTKTVVNYSDGKNTESYSVSYQGVDGTNGLNGADAITMTITSSNGTVFKNSTGSTVLTAHVFKGGVEQTVNTNGVCGTLGTVKWYKGSGTTGTASKTLTVSASTVTNAEVYTAQLE